MGSWSPFKFFVGRTANLLFMHLAASKLQPVACLLPRDRHWLLDIKRTKIVGARPIVFDVGANTGQTTHDLAIFYPKGKIYCFEPVSATCGELRKKYESLPNFYINQVALGSSPGYQEIPLHQNSELNTLVKNQPRTDDLLQETEKIK